MGEDDVRAVPVPRGAVVLQAARAFHHGGALSGLETLHESLGDVFRLPLPGFRSVVLAGPFAARFVLSESRDDLLWRAERDPVTQLLRRGMLVTDGAEHDELRRIMTPLLHKRLFGSYARAIVKSVDRVTDRWRDGERLELLDEMRCIALLSLMGTLYDEDVAPHLRDLWPDIERTIRYISPGPWLIWPTIPRLGYRGAIQRLDRYFLDLIARRRAASLDANYLHGSHGATDLITALIAAGLSDDLIRDQLMTMFIAGHDTSTALLAWSLALLTRNPMALALTVAEVDMVIGTDEPTSAHLRQLTYLDCVMKEALRLYPPIHLGSRIAATDLTFDGFRIPAGTRVLYSIYLTHRDKRYWPNPAYFDPDRFSSERGGDRPAFAYIPFGGGSRNCIGAAYAQFEAKLILARLLQRFSFKATREALHPRMRATLEPRPGARITISHRHSMDSVQV